VNYYNEHDAKAAAWLRELIKRGHIPDGIVDERSIEDVVPSELAGFTQCHFFAGIGGWSLALQLAGWPKDRPVWTGSCPCQPFSLIGKQKGAADERHLWPEFYRLITKLNPSVVFGEQVADKNGLEWLSGVRSDLEACSYAVGASNLCAAGVGSPHRRQRLYWVAYAGSTGLEGFSWNGNNSKEPGRFNAQPGGSTTETGSLGSDSTGMDALHMLRRVDLHDSCGARTRLRLSADRELDRGELGSIWSRFQQVPCSDGWRRVEPGTFPLAHGIPARVVRLRGYGNAIVPQVAATFIEATGLIQ